jgi:hypothetical protein
MRIFIRYNSDDYGNYTTFALKVTKKMKIEDVKILIFNRINIQTQYQKLSLKLNGRMVKLYFIIDPFSLIFEHIFDIL